MQDKILQLKESLDIRKDLQKHLFVRGFLVTNATLPDLNIFPFYGNWNVTKFGDFHFLTHYLTDKTFHTVGDKTFFILGHAYNPFTMEYEEKPILEKLAAEYEKDNFIEAINELTGIFVVGLVENDSIRFIVDPSGMQSACQGVVNDDFYMSSHPQLIGDICGLTMDPFVKELIQYKWYGRLPGPYLPGDLTPFYAIKRIVPSIDYSFKNKVLIHSRFGFIKDIQIAQHGAEYEKIIEKSSSIFKNTMSLIAKKWKHPAISLTGGIDSNTTFAAANGNYENYSTFSYISHKKEVPDAQVAKQIATAFNIKHDEYIIPESILENNLVDFNIKHAILNHNNGYIAKRRNNETRKRIYLEEHCKFNVEVKSWVSETIRAPYYRRYNRHNMPSLSAKLLRNLYKIFIFNRVLARKIDKVFQNYIEKYEYQKVSSSYPIVAVVFNEFEWGSWGSINISEMKFCFDITVPYNNRILLDCLFQIPLEKSFIDQHHLDMKKKLNKRLYDMNIRVVNMYETDFRARMLNIIFTVNTILPF